MASGWTTTQALADSLPTVIDAARIVREYEGVMPNVVDKVTLPEGSGTAWNEVSLSALSAMAVTETTRNDNPQQMADTLLTITPDMVQIHTFITDKTARNISKNAWARTGALAQNAIQRRKDTDGLAVFAGASTTLAGTGTTLTFGHLTAGVSRAKYGGANEPSNPPYAIVLHSYQIKDIEDSITAGIGTYTVPEGLTARVFTEGFEGTVEGAQVYRDDNITLTSTPDARGGIFAKEAIVMVQGNSPDSETDREPGWGGGGTSLFITDEYAYGERSSGNWLYGVLSDATDPTS